MCGIIGYTGKNEATKKVIEGLRVLEYRGYDSVGICVGGQTVKTKGRVGDLEKILKETPLPPATFAIGHTRWATHGAPTDTNAHPHRVGKITLVHNGIIENYKELRGELEAHGYKMSSDTDTEIAAGVIDLCIASEGDAVKGMRKALKMIKGSYAFAILVEGEGNSIYATRRGSPLILGKGEDGYYLASDITALLPFTNTYCPLEEGELVNLTRDGIRGERALVWKKTSLTYSAAQKGGYAHFMLKETWEQPQAIKACLSPRIVNSLPDFSGDGLDTEFFEEIKAVHIVACGSAMHAGLAAAHFFERLAQVPCRVFVASEYRYTPPIKEEGTLVIIVSQSGETADSLACLRYARGVGLKTLGVVNAVESSIAREADYRVYTYAGPEIAVATTKGYMTQVSLLYLFGVALAWSKDKINEDLAKSLTECLFFDCPRAIKNVLDREKEIIEVAKSIYERDHIFYIGRGVDYAISQEAALKLKEISYIHCEAYAAGELKHGTISLIEKGTPVIAVSTEKQLWDKLDSNIKEVKSRGAYTVLIGSGGKGGTDKILELEKGGEMGELFGAVATVQLLAYHVALLRGCDIDKPRNLAKSVTVE